jgi:hypothetical protein
MQAANFFGGREETRNDNELLLLALNKDKLTLTLSIPKKKLIANVMAIGSLLQLASTYALFCTFLCAVPCT